MNAAYIAAALRGRRCGSHYIARCPAHQDKNPSLSLRDAYGKVLVHCFAGCSQADVIAALRERGLWPERVKPNWSEAEKRDYGRRRARAEGMAENALLWRAATIRRLEDAKAVVAEENLARPDTDNERTLAEAARLLCSATQLSGAELAEVYRAAVKRDRAGVRKLISESLEDERHAAEATERLIAVLVRSVGNAK